MNENLESTYSFCMMVARPGTSGYGHQGESMAKRKLSPSQRAAIRKELAELLKTAKTQAEALRTVAKKYNITTITARWYAKSLKGAARPGGKAAKAGATGKAPAARRAPKASVQRNGHAAGAGGVQALVAGITDAAERALARARRAQKLVPQWQIYVKKELSLRKLEKKVRANLRAAARKAKVLGRKIKELAAR